MPQKSSLLFLIMLLLSSCAMLRESPKYDFADGKYSSKIVGDKKGKVYIENKGENIHVYSLIKNHNGYRIDTTNNKTLVFTDKVTNMKTFNPAFSQTSFDIDFLTIPFKYRFSANGFPRQFNTNVSGAIYFGYRTDVYVLHYSKTPLNVSKRNSTHFGFSFGAFTGIGGTAMNPWVTRDNIIIEYDGVVWTKGVSGIIGLNNVTFGFATGWDHLLDQNKKYWIYQGKPWVGFVFGLNLN